MFEGHCGALAGFASALRLDVNVCYSRRSSQCASVCQAHWRPSREKSLILDFDFAKEQAN